MIKQLGNRTVEGDAAKLRTLLAQKSIPTAASTKVKVSGNDSTAGYLGVKLVAGSNVTLTELNDGGNETLEIAASGGASALDDLTDVVISSEATGHALRYNGTNWVNGDFFVNLTGDTMTGPLIIDPSSGDANGLLQIDAPASSTGHYTFKMTRAGARVFDLRDDGVLYCVMGYQTGGGFGIQSLSSGSMLHFDSVSTGSIVMDNTLWSSPSDIYINSYRDFFITIEDEAEAEITDIMTIRHNSSNTPGDGFGTAIRFQGETSTTENRNIGRIIAKLDKATDATREGVISLSVFEGSTEHENLQVFIHEVYIPLDLNIDGYTLETYEEAMSAAGTTQGTATAITAVQSVVTTATAGVNDGVILPNIGLGGSIFIYNRTASTTIKVYPPSGGQIENSGTNGGRNLAASRSGQYVRTSSTQWRLNLFS